LGFGFRLATGFRFAAGLRFATTFLVVFGAALRFRFGFAGVGFSGGRKRAQRQGFPLRMCHLTHVMPMGPCFFFSANFATLLGFA
jgi:hypothetical protein